jgi:hypothetical protein
MPTERMAPARAGTSRKETADREARILRLIVRLLEVRDPSLLTSPASVRPGGRQRGAGAETRTYLITNRSLKVLLDSVIQRIERSRDPEVSVARWEDDFEDFSERFFSKLREGPLVTMERKELYVFTEDASAFLMSLWPPAPEPRKSSPTLPPATEDYRSSHSRDDGEAIYPLGSEGRGQRSACDV